MPLYDELCRCFVNFYAGCIKSDCKLINYISNQAIVSSRMNSVLGRNATLCCLRYGVAVQDIRLLSGVHIQNSVNVVNSLMPDEIHATVNMLLELIFTREHNIHIEGWLDNDINSTIEYLCTS